MIVALPTSAFGATSQSFPIPYFLHDYLIRSPSTTTFLLSASQRINDPIHSHHNINYATTTTTAVQVLTCYMVCLVAWQLAVSQ